LTSRTILTAALRKWGYEPIAVVNGLDAWNILQQPDSPRLVILDWNMPELDGIDVCRRVRAASNSAPPYLILLTCMSEKGDIVKGLDAGANDYISKPYDNEELHARIRVGQKMVEMQAELIRTRDALAFEATHDPLTGILNRRAIMARLQEEVTRAQRQQTSLHIGMCDIDLFKSINDRYGHQIGDEVLCEFVRILQAELRSYDGLGRYGGEEFLVISPGAPGIKCDALYSRLNAKVASHPIVTDAGSIPITISIGVARCSTESGIDAMIAAADEALYRAKRSGRNCVVHAALD
jgi:two-component system, cell cycle response regulator